MQIDEAREFIKFLHGAVPWNGTWFGEYAPGERGAYWWRKHLDEAIAALIAAPAAPQQAEPVAWMAFGGALVHAVTRNAMDPIEAERFDVPLYLHPPAAPQQAEPVAWVRNLTDPQPHCVTGLQYRTAADADAGVQYIPVYLHPPAAEVRLQGGLDNEELLEAWRTKVPGVEPTDSDLRAFALGVEFGTRGKRVYFDERNSARDAWRRRVKQCETLEAEVQRLRDALEQIEREANQPYIQRIAAAALKVGE